MFRSVHHVVLPDVPRDQPATRLKVLPTTWPRLLMPAGKGGTISRQNAEVCDCAVSAVRPKRGNDGCAVSGRDIPNSLAVVINGVGGISIVSEVWKLEGSVVCPQYGVSRYAGAGSRGAYGLALIVDALYEAIWVASHRRKRSDFAFFPNCRRYDLSRLASWASGVLDRRFRNAYYLSAVIGIVFRISAGTIIRPLGERPARLTDLNRRRQMSRCHNLRRTVRDTRCT